MSAEMSQKSSRAEIAPGTLKLLIFSNLPRHQAGAMSHISRLRVIAAGLSSTFYPGNSRWHKILRDTERAVQQPNGLNA